VLSKFGYDSNCIDCAIKEMISSDTGHSFDGEIQSASFVSDIFMWLGQVTCRQ